MTITNALMESVANSAGQRQDVRAESGASFSKTLKEAVSKPMKAKSYQETAHKTNAKANIKSTEENLQKQSNEAENNQKPQNSAENKKSEAKEDAVKSEKSKVKDAVKELPKTDKEILDQSIITSVANVLQISEEQVSGIIESLGFTASDLLEKENLNVFMQKAFNAENPIELLKVDNINEIFKELEKVTEETAAEFVNEGLKIAGQETVQPNNASDAVGNSADGEKTEIFSKTGQTVEIESETENVSDGKAIPQVKTEQSEKTNGQTANFAGNGGEDNRGTEENAAVYNALQPEQVEFKNISSVRVKAEQLKNINNSDVVAQMIEKIKVDVKPNISEVRISLRPEALGEISLKIATENGIVTAQFVAENEKVKQIIESNFNQLKQALNEQGIVVSELSVSVSGGDRERQMQEFLQGRSKSQARINSIINGISEEEEKALNVVDTRMVYNNQIEYLI